MNQPVRYLAALMAAMLWCLPADAQPHTVAAVRADRTNLRAQPSTDAEVLATLHKGDLLEVLGEEIPPGQKEIWSRVVLPPSVMVWIHSQGVDKAGIVRNDRIHFRAGAGKNYSVLGSLRRGDSVVVIREFDDWLQIAPPQGASAYVASRLLGSPESPAPAPAVPAKAPATTAQKPAAPTGTTPATATAPVPPPAPVARSKPPVTQPAAQPVPQTAATTTPPQPAPSAPNPTTAAPSPTPSGSAPKPAGSARSSAPFPDPAWADIAKPTPSVRTNKTSPPPAPAPVAKPAATNALVKTVVSAPPAPRPRASGSPRDQVQRGRPAPPAYPVLVADPDPGRPKTATPPPEPRRVTREGIVGPTWSPHAPSDYELRDGFYSEGVLDYLYLEPQKDLKKFNGKRVRVQGEEYLDSRWRTPVLKVKSIDLVP